jgi:hypothetical protein
VAPDRALNSGAGIFLVVLLLRGDVLGLGDPLLRISVNFFGAPALSMAEYPAYRQDVIVGASLQVTAPLGQYDPDKLLNVGTNRWPFIPSSRS